MEHLVWDIILRHHKASGLYESCLKSDVTITKAEEMILEKLVSVGIKEGQLIIAGNSVHMDKLFIYHHMPKLYVFLHSDILDVSSIKLFVNAKNPYLFYKKLNKHRALDDIRESIGELAFYMQYALKWFDWKLHLSRLCHLYSGCIILILIIMHTLSRLLRCSFSFNLRSPINVDLLKTE